MSELPYTAYYAGYSYGHDGEPKTRYDGDVRTPENPFPVNDERNKLWNDGYLDGCVARRSSINN